MKETLTAFARVPEKTVRGALWYCAGNHELLSCFSVLSFVLRHLIMMFATPIIVIIFIQLFQFNTVG